MVGNVDFCLLEAKHWIHVVAGLHLSLTYSPSKYYYSTRSVSKISSCTLHEQDHIKKNDYNLMFQFMARMSFHKEVDEYNGEHWARRMSEDRHRMRS